MITHTEYINRLNDFITKSNEAIGNEIALLQNKAPEAEIKAAQDLIHENWMVFQTLMQEKIDPATMRKVAKGEDMLFVFLDDIT